MKISISTIKIDSRIRKEPGDIEELASSLARFGQLQPIILDQDGMLVAGGRRLAAAMHLGWTDIEAIRKDDVDDILRREIELEENLRRKELTWVEEVRAVRDLYKMKGERYGQSDRRTSVVARLTGEISGEGYSMQDAANELDRSKASVVTDVGLANALDEFPYLTEEKSKAAAWKRFKRDKETQLRQEQARRTQHETKHDISQAQATKGETPDTTPSTAISGPKGTIRQPITKISWKGKGILYLADSRDLLSKLPPASIDCIVTDPPYALGMFKEGQTTAGARLASNAGGMYDDDPHKIMEMLDVVMMHCARVLKPQGHAYVFMHMTRYEEMYLMLRNHFGTCEETPIVWVKNTPGVGDPNTNWVYAYEPCLFVNRGRHLVKPQAFNYLRYDTIPPNQKIHPTQKPPALLRHLIQASCLSDEVILDPFAGSGSTLVAASQVGVRFVGCERHEPFHRAAVDYISGEIADIEAKKEEITA